MDCLISKISSFSGDLKKLCLEDESNPIVIAGALDDATGKEWRGWDAETLVDFLKLPKDAIKQLDKIMAVQVALTNPDVFEDWHLFVHCNSAFNHRRASFEWLDAPSYLELAWTCTVLNALNRGNSYQPGVLRFVTAICAHDGLVFFPWIGGDGFDLCEQEWSKGWIDPELCKIVSEVKNHWRTGALEKLQPSDVSDTNPVHVQVAKIVNAYEYIRRNSGINR